MMATCPECGKLHCVHWPEHWPYRRGTVYYCCEECLNTQYYKQLNMLKTKHKTMKREMRQMEMKIKPEQKQEAIRMALNGINPTLFLQECGAKNPSATWCAIKNYLKKNDPDTYALLPDFRKGSKTEPEPEEEPEDLPVVPVTGPVVIETPAPMSDLPIMLDDFQVTAISNPEFGEFYYDRKHNCIDWRDLGGDEISMAPAGWNNLIEALPKVLRMLGVQVYGGTD